jgi:hypothetical protein
MILKNRAFWLSFSIVFLVTILLLSRSEQIKPVVTTIKLVAGCQLDFFDRTIQPNNTLVLACPGKDYVRLWPLPVMQPWFEDWLETPTPMENSLQGMPLHHLTSS